MALKSASLALLAFAVTIIALVAPPANAAQNMTTGFADSIFRAPDETERDNAFALSTQEGARIVRINVIWREIAGANPPANAADPADPSYNFTELDGAVRSAAASGTDVMFTVYSAPDWAEGEDRPPVSDDYRAGTWKPSPSDYADFGRALAARYSGSFTPAGASTPLPQVRNFEAWNEENISFYLTPQYKGRKRVGTGIYRQLLNAFYDGVHDVNKHARVIFGGNAPYGDPPPNSVRTQPVVFLKDLLCLSNSLKPLSCPNPAKFDVLGIHPINTSGGPTLHAMSPDDASSADISRLTKVLHAAEKLGTVDGGHHPVWGTEFWWESAPSPRAASLQKHGRFIDQALYLFWKAGLKVAINLQLYDTPAADEQALEDTYQAGLYAADGTPKPAATSFRFPFVTERRSKSKLFVWGKSPIEGSLEIQRKANGDWQKMGSIKVKANRVFTTTVKARGRLDLRAVVGDQTSLPWTQRK